ncbi:MAG: hypothetical protein ABIP20_16150 [Chthoniobacteraceae bacterium]
MSARGLRWNAAAVFVMLAAVIPAVLWPGDNLWTNDEPRLIANAWHSNAEWHPAWGGLWGNLGIRYGPLPTQIYQFLLCLTHDPLVLAALRGALSSAVTAASLLWLARSAGMSPWFAGAALVAPPVLQFQRLLWDASFTIPLGALALAALAAYLRGGTRRSLVTAITASAFLATIHPQALPLSGAIVGFLLWKHRPALRRHRRPIGIALAIFLVLNAVFFGQLVHLIFTRLSGAVASGYPGGKAPHIAILAPFLGGRLLAAPADAYASTGPDAWMQMLTTIIYPLCWAGIAVAVCCARRHWKNRGAEIPGDSALPASPHAVRECLALVALATVIMQGLLFAAMRVPSGAQYFFGTFAAHVCLAWLAVEALPWLWLRGAISAVYGFAGAWLSFHGMWTAHRDGCPVEPMQPTLGQQTALAHSLGSYDSPLVFSDVPHLQDYPQGVRSLMLLVPHSSGKKGARILVAQRPGAGALRGDFDMRELGGTEAIPDSAKPIIITPLPEGWYPGALEPRGAGAPSPRD